VPGLSVAAMPANGLIGDDGADVRDSTEGDVRDAGASIVKVRSSDVRFDA